MMRLSGEIRLLWRTRPSNQPTSLRFRSPRAKRRRRGLRELASGLEVKMRRLVDANVIGIFIWNLEGRIVEANEAFLHMVQYGPEDLALGRVRWRDLTPAEWHDRDDRAEADLQCDRNLPAVREGVLPEKRKSRAGAGRRRVVRKGGKGWCRFRTRFERAKTRRRGVREEWNSRRVRWSIPRWTPWSPWTEMESSRTETLRRKRFWGGPAWKPWGAGCRKPSFRCRYCLVHAPLPLLLPDPGAGPFSTSESKSLRSAATARNFPSSYL